MWNRGGPSFAKMEVEAQFLTNEHFAFSLISVLGVAHSMQNLVVLLKLGGEQVYKIIATQTLDITYTIRNLHSCCNTEYHHDSACGPRSTPKSVIQMFSITTCIIKMLNIHLLLLLSHSYMFSASWCWLGVKQTCCYDNIRLRFNVKTFT